MMTATNVAPATRDILPKAGRTVAMTWGRRAPVSHRAEKVVCGATRMEGLWMAFPIPIRRKVIEDGPAAAANRRLGTHLNKSGMMADPMCGLAPGARRAATGMISAAARITINQPTGESREAVLHLSHRTRRVTRPPCVARPPLTHDSVQVAGRVRGTEAVPRTRVARIGTVQLLTRCCRRRKLLAGARRRPRPRAGAASLPGLPSPGASARS